MGNTQTFGPFERTICAASSIGNSKNISKFMGLTPPRRQVYQPVRQRIGIQDTHMVVIFKLKTQVPFEIVSAASQAQRFYSVLERVLHCLVHEQVIEMR